MKLIFVITLIFLFFVVKSDLFLDPDFGWHLKTGEVILQSGVPQTDPFSYSMQSYRFVPHEWLSDVFMAAFYPIVKMSGLAIVSALIGVIAIVISVLASRTKNLWAWGFVLLTAGVLLSFVDIRPWVVSWLFFSVVIALIHNWEHYQKFKIYLPLLFLLWANLHGGFVAGLGTLGVFMGVESISQRKNFLPNWSIFTLSVLSTLINPYGIALWGEIGKTLANSEMRSQIVEWGPSYGWFDPAVAALVMLSLFGIVKFRKKFPGSLVAVYFVTLLSGTVALRNLPLLAIASLPVAARSVGFFVLGLKGKVVMERFNAAGKIFFLGCLILFVIKAALTFQDADNFSERNFYPVSAVNFLKGEKISGNLFSTYEWGGYLIWKLPEKGVFVDGRMPFWKLTSKGKAESANAFGEYEQILNGKRDLGKFVEKYDITFVLWPKERPRSKLIDDFENLIWRYFPKQKKKRVDLVKKLKEMGWTETYDDETAIVVQKRLGH